jgi:hypothetical protein
MISSIASANVCLIFVLIKIKIKLKMKLSLCLTKHTTKMYLLLNLAPCHEDVFGEWRYSSIHFKCRH